LVALVKRFFRVKLTEGESGAMPAALGLWVAAQSNFGHGVRRLAPIFAALMSKGTLILLDPEISKPQKSL